MQNEISSISKTNLKKSVSGKEKLQTRWLIDLADDQDALNSINNLLVEANDISTIGGKVTLKELLKVLLPKLKKGDIEKMRKMAMTDEDIAKQFALEYNEKHGTNLSQTAILARIAKRQPIN